MKEKDFKFHIPVDLVKGKKEEDAADSWQIQGIASTDDPDLQGETVDQNGLDITPLKAGRGLFNHDHQKGPENVIGQIEDGDFVEHEGKKALLVKGYLFKHQERAKSFYNILRSLKKGSGHRVHMSIEGKILQRDLKNRANIKKARIDKVAITLDPVNPNTYTQLIKSLNAPEPEVPETVEAPQSIDNIEEFINIKKTDLQKLVEISEKALAAGAGHAKAPEARTGGEATSMEDLEARVKNQTYGQSEKKKKLKKTMISSLIENLIKAHPKHDPMELAKWVIEAYLDKKGE